MNNLFGLRTKLIAASLIVIAIATHAYSTAYAHHSAARYDTRQTITIKGVVTRCEWANPHVYVYIEETTDTGKKVEWQIEGAPPGILKRMGWFADTLHVGDSITVSGSPTRNPDSKGLFPSVIKRGDSTLFSAQGFAALATPTATAKTNSLNGTWSTAISMQVLGQAASPAVSKLTKEGAQALKRYDETTSPTSNCIPLPPPMFMIIPDFKRITIGAAAIQIEDEYDGARRTIHMNAATHDGALPSIKGHSIGRWEGKSLVIDTTRFAYHGTGNGGGNGIGPGLPSGIKKHLVERLTPNEDGTSLTYHFELTDPEYLAVPRTGDFKWVFSPDAKFEAEKCNLEIARRFLKD